MPYTKTIALRTWTSINNIFEYLQAEDHPHHLEYTVEPMRPGGSELTPQKLLAEVRKTVEKILKDKLPGRPIKNLFNLHIIRVADYTWLTREERDEFASLYTAWVAPEGLSCHCWHVNRATGAADLNVLAANLVDLHRPRARRRSDSRELAEARTAADEVTDYLNEKRKQQNRSPIVTMPERQQQLAAAKRGRSLEQELAEAPNGITLCNIRSSIEEIGHEVVRFNPEADYISIRFRDQKRDQPATANRRGKRFQITWLLKQIGAVRRRRPSIGGNGFGDSRDHELDRMVADWNVVEP